MNLNWYSVFCSAGCNTDCTGGWRFQAIHTGECNWLCRDRLQLNTAFLSFVEQLYLKGVLACIWWCVSGIWKIRPSLQGDADCYSVVPPKRREVVVPWRKWFFVVIQQHVIVTGLPALSHLDDSYIFVCLLTRRHSWARSPMGLAMPGKWVAYCTQQDSS